MRRAVLRLQHAGRPSASAPLTHARARAGAGARPAGRRRPEPAPAPLAHPARAADAVARAACRGAFLVKCNRAEARLLTGEDDPARAAEALLAGGAQHVVVTLGADGALLRGAGPAPDVPGVPARPVDATGAGDAVIGVLLARLARAGFYPAALAAALPEAAVEAGARATERWGAVA